MDLVATYAPLLQAISRIGCFFAGCCYGQPTLHSWAISSVECVSTHPTQLYSAASLALLFLVMYAIRRIQLAPGQQFCIYLFFMSLERFVVDFWRADQEFTSIITTFSVAQITALFLAATAVGSIIYISLYDRRQS